MRGDRNVRDSFIMPLIVNENMSEEPESLLDILNKPNNLHKHSFYQFQTPRVNGITQNTLNRYMPYLIDKNECFDLLKFKPTEARFFEYKTRSLSKYLYGTTDLYFIIKLFNDIQHDSELSYNFLTETGIRVLNSAGLKVLDDLLRFQQRVETVDGDDAFIQDVY